MKYVFRTLMSIGILFVGVSSFAAEPLPLPPDPIYMFTGSGWRGFYVRNNEFLQFTVIGKEVKPRDAYHILVQEKPFLGIMVTFADKREFGPGDNILEAHREWETAYWRSQAEKVETEDRKDLAGSAGGIKVTKYNIWAGQPEQFLDTYIVSIASGDGAYAFSISPAKNATEDFIKSFVGTIKLVNERFDVTKENQKLKSEIGADKKQ